MSRAGLCNCTAASEESSSDFIQEVLIRAGLLWASFLCCFLPHEVLKLDQTILWYLLYRQLAVGSGKWLGKSEPGLET